ncbi:MAG: DUF2934 domain-containing protein [Gemmatimonadota bacterium]|nr:MAG: DUF2934 domain-containing protein [Gemmatimonadota bacterium]
MNEKIEMIRQLAYYIWEREGRPPDRALQNWLEAESTVSGGISGLEVAAAKVERKSAKRSAGRTTAKRAASGKASVKKAATTGKTKKKTAKKTTKRARKKS